MRVSRDVQHLKRHGCQVVGVTGRLHLKISVPTPWGEQIVTAGGTPGDKRCLAHLEADIRRAKRGHWRKA